MGSIVISAILLISCIALFVVLCYRGFGPIPCAVLCSIIMAVVAEGGFWNALFNVWVQGAMGFCGNMILPFLTGGIFGHFLNITGASDRLGSWLVAKTGPRFSVYCIALLTGILLYAGVMSYVFVVAYVGCGILRAANLPRQVGLAIMSGYGAVFITCLPGSAFVVNLVPTFTLGTDIYAAPLIGIACAIVAIVIITIYVEMLVRACRKDGAGYVPMDGEDGAARAESDMPSVVIVLISLLIVVVGSLIFIKGAGLDSQYALFATQIIASVFLLITCRKYIHTKHGHGILNEFFHGTQAALQPLIASSAVTGFASVVALSPMYGAMLGWLGSLNMNPYVLTVIGVAIICAISADCIGGLSAFMALLAPQMIAQGADPSAVHRLATVTSGTFDSLPHNGNVNIALQVWGLNHKEGYKHIFWTQTLLPCVFAIIGCILAILLY